MNIHNLKLQLIWCHVCLMPRRFGVETYFYDNDVRCLCCDDDKNKGAHLGYAHDIPKEWLDEMPEMP